jgi:hypothetical protein
VQIYDIVSKVSIAIMPKYFAVFPHLIITDRQHVILFPREKGMCDMGIETKKTL